MGCVYLIAFSSGKYYVGLTSKSVVERLTSHEQLAFGSGKQKKAVHHAMNKHIYKVYTLFSCDNLSHLKMMEIAAIKQLGSISPAGYNLTAGGDGGLCPSEETRKKLSAASKGKKHSEETRSKISRANKGKKKSEAQVLKMKQRPGVRWSDERRIQFSKFRTGKRFAESVKIKMSESAKIRWTKQKENQNEIRNTANCNMPS